ncbi:IclR family transcriptional regulator [Cohnella sp. LGH]|uniref:IclR family transcriptional regulator n=1 Tax=Cohnella sp. LGH TaxID=1619153 RepID=UPI001ADB3436|nr:IclR family transcriptional regulator [Cohnella sp. LGH]QTH40392.1 IclR family transcriptional regulator [Cohnella sp. LGH]
MNEKKYWAPAIEKAHYILNLIAREPHKLRLMDLSARLGINKSSMFTLLATLEELEWIGKREDGTYALGSTLGHLGSAYLGQYDLAARFREEAAKSRDLLNETIQLAKLDGGSVLYLEKVEAPSRVRLVSEPGMRFPAHATALGKALLAGESEEAWLTRLGEEPFEVLTPNTITQRGTLSAHLREVKAHGYSTEEQEAVMGFCCTAAPVLGPDGKAIAAVSASLPLHKWQDGKEKSIVEIKRLAQRLSLSEAAIDKE